MAVVQERRQVVPMTFWDLHFACLKGGKVRTGNLIVPAPDPDSAIEFVRENPSWFGLTEHAMVGHATSLTIGGSFGLPAV